MTAIWHNNGSGWRLLAPSSFPAEAALHELIEQAPHIMPLAGSPQLVVLGKEVLLGGNYADLIAVEPSGRLAIIEIKLARNAEARRAVIAQILTYAAFLRGLDVAMLETDILGSHLSARGHQSLADAVGANDQTGAFDARAFPAALAECLRDGRFRLVLVLDDAPDELVRLVGYLEAVTDKLVIDLVTVAAYDIGDSRVIVPQRVEPEHQAPRAADSTPANSTPKGRFVPGAGDFEQAIRECPADHQPLLRRLTEWAKALESEGLANLGTYHGVADRLTLLPRLPDEGVGMVTIWNDHGAYLQFWRSVIARRAPGLVARIESLAAPANVGQGTTTRNVSDALLDALTAAYREAVNAHHQPEHTD